MARESISQDYLDGIYEAYSTLMTNQIFLKLLDEKSTVKNIYEESKEKKYLEPLQLVGKFEMSVSLGEQDVEGNQTYATVTIPTKSLLLHGLDITPKNYKTLENGVISYDGLDYEIKRVDPRTNIDNVFQFYVFYCEKPKIRR